MVFHLSVFSNMMVMDNTNILSLADLTPKLSSYLTGKQNIQVKNMVLCLKLDNIVMLMDCFKDKHTDIHHKIILIMMATVNLKITNLLVLRSHGVRMEDMILNKIYKIRWSKKNKKFMKCSELLIPKKRWSENKSS